MQHLPSSPAATHKSHVPVTANVATPGATYTAPVTECVAPPALTFTAPVTEYVTPAPRGVRGTGCGSSSPRINPRSCAGHGFRVDRGRTRPPSVRRNPRTLCRAHHRSPARLPHLRSCAKQQLQCSSRASGTRCLSRSTGAREQTHGLGVRTDGAPGRDAAKK